MLDRRHKPSIPASAGVGEVLPPAADRQSEVIDVGVDHLPSPQSLCYLLRSQRAAESPSSRWTVT